MELKNYAQESLMTVKQEVSYTSLIETNDFKSLIKRKKAFILPMTIFFFVFYFSLPILAAYTKVLTTNAIGHITWAWVFALLQFVLVWVSGIIYIKKSEYYDKEADDILTKYKEELNV